MQNSGKWTTSSWITQDHMDSKMWYQGWIFMSEICSVWNFLCSQYLSKLFIAPLLSCAVPVSSIPWTMGGRGQHNRSWRRDSSRDPVKQDALLKLPFEEALDDHKISDKLACINRSTNKDLDSLSTLHTEMGRNNRKIEGWNKAIKRGPWRPGTIREKE